MLAAFEFDNGWLWLTEAGTQRRASLHVVEGEAGLQSLSAGGIEPLERGLAAFTAALRTSNHTLKRSLTDPHIFSGIGNAYSDEILHRAQLSPIAMTQKLTAQEIERLYEATRATLLEWTDRLRAEAGGAFPEKVTAFRPEMAVHGRYGQPCPRCGAKVQRIRYASNETNYCAQLPDRRPPARRSRFFPPATRRLAAHAGRTRSAEEAIVSPLVARVIGAQRLQLTAERQEGHQHWNAEPVGRVGLRVEFGCKEAFLDARLEPQAQPDQHPAHQRRCRGLGDRRRKGCG